MKIDLNGSWELENDKFGKKTVSLPGTLDENKVGDQDVVAKPWHLDVEDKGDKIKKLMNNGNVITSRLTRNYTYEGPARFTKVFEGEVKEDKRYFLVVERARHLSLKVDGKSVNTISGSLSTPYSFEITGLLRAGSTLELTSDNTYPGLPYQDIVFSSAATDESQTNWNGLIGDIYIEEKDLNFIGDVHVYPVGKELDIEVDIYLKDDFYSNNIDTKKCFIELDDILSGQGQLDDKHLDLVLSGECLEDEVVIEDVLNWAEDGSTENIPNNNCALNIDDLCENHGKVVTVKLHNVALNDSALTKKWDEFEGNLHTLEVSLLAGLSDESDDSNSNEQLVSNSIEPDTSKSQIDDLSMFKKVVSTFTACFGIRSFSYDEDGRLTLNGRRIFLRGEANCAYFPETGHPPMDDESWEKILKTYMSYGVNCLRFHSWCPPEAAFRAGDRLGLMLQPELSNWNPRTAFGSAESKLYYEKELREILKSYANHPSFVMLTLGNELQGDESGIEEMHRFLDIAKELDPTRLYSWGSNNFYGANGTDEKSDFFTSARFKDRHIRESGNKGIFNTRYPASKFDFEYVMEDLRKEYKKPVFGFEVGQYEILPDFDELEDFKGVTRADNIAVVRDKVRNLGISDKEWKNRVNATGEISLLSYREEVEAVMRTESMSGLSLLGLQDFPGQGTALVGMLNSHLKAKPFDFAKPERFRAFFRESAILALLPRYTYTSKDILEADIKVANYGKKEICKKIVYKLVSEDGSEYARGVVDNPVIESMPSGTDKADSRNPLDCYKVGNLTYAGKISIDLNKVPCNTRFNMLLTTDDETLTNTYPIWVYVEDRYNTLVEDIKDNKEGNTSIPKCPEGIYETRCFDEKAIEVLSNGGKVYLSPPSTKEAMPNSIKAQFSTDFWSVGTFPEQEGAMGQLIDANHPIFETFPTEDHTNYQWWPMATQRALILPEYMDTIITEMDCFAYLRPMTQLMEVNCAGGKLLISSMGLQNLMQYPEARALLSSIYKYMDSDKFEPKAEMSKDKVLAIFTNDQKL